jgi:putative transposase
LDAGLIELSTGEHACAMMMLAKKDVLGDWMEKQMWGNYRPINRKTKLDYYPMPSPKELFDGLGKARLFSTLDLRLGYYQLPLRFEDRMKTAFWRVDEDGRNTLFHWKFLPFGLKNTPATFQCIMDQVLKELPFSRCYIDDVIIFSDTPEEHIKHLQ